MPDARRTRSLACEKQKAHERSHRELAETIRHSPRDGFTVSFALARRPGFLASVPRVMRSIIARLISASGYQAHTTSPSAASSLVS